MASQRQIEANRRNGAIHGPLSQREKDHLREVALRNRPWEKSTGPRTAKGKRRSAMNALKTGKHTAKKRAWRKDALRFIQLDQVFRGAVLGEVEVEDVGALARELAELAGRLS